MVFRTCLISFFLITLLYAVSMNGSAVAGLELSDCSTNTCLFLPLVNNPAPVRVVATMPRNSLYGEFWIIGEVMTTSERPVYGVNLVLNVYDPAGQLLGSEPGITNLEATLPGQSNPFSIVTSITESIGRYEVNITDWSLESDQDYRSVATEITGLEEWPSGTWVYAEARNDEPIPLAEIYETAWSLGQSVPNFGRFLADCLVPEETVAFSEFLWGVHGNELDTIQTAAQGVIESCTP